MESFSLVVHGYYELSEVYAAWLVLIKDFQKLLNLALIVILTVRKANFLKLSNIYVATIILIKLFKKSRQTLPLDLIYLLASYEAFDYRN